MKLLGCIYSDLTEASFLLIQFSFYLTLTILYLLIF